MTSFSWSSRSIILMPFVVIRVAAFINYAEEPLDMMMEAFREPVLAPLSIVRLELPFQIAMSGLFSGHYHVCTLHSVVECCRWKAMGGQFQQPLLAVAV